MNSSKRNFKIEDFFLDMVENKVCIGPKMHLLLVVHYCIERIQSFPTEIALKEVG